MSESELAGLGELGNWELQATFELQRIAAHPADHRQAAEGLLWPGDDERPSRASANGSMPSGRRTVAPI